MTKKNDQSPEKEIQTLFDLGAHMGHKKSRLHPKAAQYVYTIINGITIIDLTKTVDLLHCAEQFLHDQAAEGKKVLVVATKRTGSSVVADICQEHMIPFITTKWLPGLLTNFETLIKNVQKLKKLKEEKESGEWKQYVKHEQTQLTKKMSRLQKFYGGIEYLDKIPDVLLILDIKKENNAVIEAHKYKIPLVAMVDTNANPELVQYPVVANDDAPEVVEYFMKRLIQSYIEGKKLYSPSEKKEEKKEDKKKEEKKEKKPKQTKKKKTEK